MASRQDQVRQRFALVCPENDTRERLVCGDCGWIHYENPRVIVGAIVRNPSGILFCRRAIRPRYGFWTIPAGFLEIGESPEDGAKREIREESGAEVRIESLLGIYAVPRIGQIHLVYLAELVSCTFDGRPESLEVRQFEGTQDSIPWDELAFPVNHWALRDYLSLNGRSVSQPFGAKPEDLLQRMSSVDYHPDFVPAGLQNETSSEPSEETGRNGL